MPEFSISVHYCTRTGRPGRRDMIRKARSVDAAINRVRGIVQRAGGTKIDIKAWPINEWKEPK